MRLGALDVRNTVVSDTVGFKVAGVWGQTKLLQIADNDDKYDLQVEYTSMIYWLNNR